MLYIEQPTEKICPDPPDMTAWVVATQSIAAVNNGNSDSAVWTDPSSDVTAVDEAEDGVHTLRDEVMVGWSSPVAGGLFWPRCRRSKIEPVALDNVSRQRAGRRIVDIVNDSEKPSLFNPGGFFQSRSWSGLPKVHSLES